ncbi:hypothetical protein F2Q69_00042053 [Brassica cretica]|uniref:Uncharacterized protein n=1 Tax=Brassica cretica TaxID=69181 RepID=A0A8S9NQN3_BRACR|nr:hypothetical protein F2Q69_00042053 [Brassica cretica]
MRVAEEAELLHLELKPLPRIYAHRVDNGVTWSVFLLRRNRSEPEAPLQIPSPNICDTFLTTPFPSLVFTYSLFPAFFQSSS